MFDPGPPVCWRAWYSMEESYGSSSYESAWDDFAALPESGIQIVMAYYNDGTRRNVGGNTYIWMFRRETGEWDLGQGEDPSLIPEGAVTKTGTWISDEDWDALQAYCMDDPSTQTCP